MKKVALEETYTHNHSDVSVATEYPFGDRDIDIATAVIKGKYPDKGFCVNTQVKEIIYVIEGEGEIHKDSEIVKFKAGDAILIEKNEKYFWIANCKVAMSCSPSWSPEQYLVIDEENEKSLV